MNEEERCSVERIVRLQAIEWSGMRRLMRLEHDPSFAPPDGFRNNGCWHSRINAGDQHRPAPLNCLESDMQKQTPERIYHWLDSQLSIARHYGGCKFNGADYVIAYNEEGQPLVRADLLKKPKRVKKKNEQVAAQLPLQPRSREEERKP